MDLVFSKYTGFRLDEPENFKSFKLVLEGFSEGEHPLIEELDYEGIDHVWVLPAHVMKFSISDEWRSRFQIMLENAEKYGWIHPDTQGIKAHIQWQPEIARLK